MANSDTYEWRLVGTTLAASATDKILPVITSNFQFVLNEGTGGAVTIPLDCSAASTITEGMLVVLYYRGAVRGSFLVENIRKVPGQEGAKEVLSVSGRGGMTVLDRAIIWGDGTTSTTRTFTSVTKASILVTLVTEAQARSGLSTLTLDFDAVNDSDSVAWTDSETYKLNVGTSLLDLVRQFAKTGIDFEVTYSGTGFVLSAYKNGIGTDKSETVFFRTGKNCQEIDIDQRGNDIKNALLVAYQAGQIVVTDSTSITANGRREELLDARLAQTAASATTYGAAILDTVKDTKIGRTINVYDGVSPYLFVNYILGDTVTLDIEGTETTDRILGIQCNFDNGEYSNVVIELNSLMLEQNLRMQQDIDYLLNNWQTAHDAGLLEVSYWAAIGDPNIALSIVAMLTIGTKIYYLGTGSSGNLVSYETTTGTWETLVSYGGLDTPYCMTLIGTDIYIGTSAAVYKYATSTSTLTNIGSITVGDPEIVYCITAVGTDIYIGGVFSAVDGVAANDLAKYDTLTDTWTAGMGSGVTGVPLVMLTSGTDVYMGGTFTAVDGVSASRIAKWNGSTWAALDAGLDFTVYSLAVYGTNILAGGDFTGKISEWNGSAWATFGGGVGDIVRGIAVYLTDVYIVGDFTDVGNYIARYSGGTWWELGTGLNASTTDIVLIDDDVYVGGNFTTAGDKPASKVAAYFNNFESLVDYLENSSSSFNMGAAIHSATASTISDSDEVPFWEDVANALRKITWANIKATLKTYFDTLYVALTGNQTIAGVKTFSSDPIIPDEAYDATAWNGSLEPPTKNAVRDKIETVGLPAGSNLQVQINNSGVFGADDEFEYTLGGQIISLGRKAGAEASAVWSWQTGGVSFHNLASWGTGNYSSIRGILARGTKASPTAAQADDIAMRFRGSAYDGVGLVLSSATGAEIRFVANENQSATNHGMRAEIWTTPDGSTTEAKVLTIGANGALTLTPGTPADGLDFMKFTATNAWTLQQSGTGSSAMLEFFSDTADKYFRFNPNSNTAGGLIVANTMPTGTLERFMVEGTGDIKAQVSTLSTTGYAFFRLKNDAGTVANFGAFGSARAGTLFGINQAGLFAIYGSLPFVIGTTDTNTFTLGNNNAARVSIGALVTNQVAVNYAADAQASDTYVITLAPALLAYSTGLEITFKANTANTGAATINVNGLGAKTIVKAVSTALANNDILAGMFCKVIYDGTNFVLLNPRVL